MAGRRGSRTSGITLHWRRFCRRSRRALLLLPSSAYVKSNLRHLRRPANGTRTNYPEAASRAARRTSPLSGWPGPRPATITVFWAMRSKLRGWLPKPEPGIPSCTSFPRRACSNHRQHGARFRPHRSPRRSRSHTGPGSVPHIIAVAGMEAKRHQAIGPSSTACCHRDLPSTDGGQSMAFSDHRRTSSGSTCALNRPAFCAEAQGTGSSLDP